MSKRVLVADDHDDTRLMIRLMLEHYGLTVIEAVNGEQAVGLAVNESPDIILMDIAMPKLNGLEATRLIRQHPELQKVPIIATTAYGSQFVDEALAAGCNDVMQKPTDVLQFQSFINQWIN